MLALEKARRLAGEGFRTLLVCFNQRLAAELIRETADVDAPAGLIVTTFHRLCERLGTEAGLLPPRPREPIPAEWWNETLPGALERGCAEGRIEHFDAVIVDEGQDFDLRWLRALAGLLPGPDDGILWVFHDPGQAVLRDDPVGALGLPVVELHENLRNPASVAELSARFYVAGETVSALRDDGGPRHRIVIAEPGEPTLVALRKELHRLVQEEQVPGFRIAVLVGCSMSESEVWRRGEFGNELLVNEAFHDDGRLKGLPPEHLPEEPSEILCETIRRFKGLEREVVILVELNPATPRLDQVLYAGLTRATTHLTVIAPPELEGRLRGG